MGKGFPGCFNRERPVEVQPAQSGASRTSEQARRARVWAALPGRAGRRAAHNHLSSRYGLGHSHGKCTRRQQRLISSEKTGVFPSVFPSVFREPTMRKKPPKLVASAASFVKNGLRTLSFAETTRAVLARQADRYYSVLRRFFL